MDLQLHAAAESYRKVLRMAGDQPQQIISEAHLGLARVLYEWNDLAEAERVGPQSLQLARQYERVIDRFIASEVFLALLKLAHPIPPLPEALSEREIEVLQLQDQTLKVLKTFRVFRKYPVCVSPRDNLPSQPILLFYLSTTTSCGDFARHIPYTLGYD